MKQMGIAQEEIPAERVIIEKSDKNRIIIENPSVTKIIMQGRKLFRLQVIFQKFPGRNRNFRRGYKDNNGKNRL